MSQHERFNRYFRARKVITVIEEVRFLYASTVPHGQLSVSFEIVKSKTT